MDKITADHSGRNIKEIHLSTRSLNLKVIRYGIRGLGFAD